jgi:hypothetical protein
VFPNNDRDMGRSKTCTFLDRELIIVTRDKYNILYIRLLSFALRLRSSERCSPAVQRSLEN